MMKKKIAVIGSGMAGLAAGWLSSKAGADVTIFEAQLSRGMDFHTQFLYGKNEPAVQNYHRWIDYFMRQEKDRSWGLAADQG